MLIRECFFFSTASFSIAVCVPPKRSFLTCYPFLFTRAAEATISAEAIAATAAVVARALHRLAYVDATPPPLPLNATVIKATVEALKQCLIAWEGPGLRCPLAAAMMTPTSTSGVGPPSHYVGIIQPWTEGE